MQRMNDTQMLTVRRALAEAAARLGDRLEADVLLAHSLGQSRSWLFAHADDELPLARQTAFMALVERRAAGEPVAYLTGRRGFWSFELDVSPATLIPRPETELLVEQALARMPVDSPCRVVDLGTGSGAIALALARERPLAAVVAVDRSAAALAVARANAMQLSLERVRFVEGDWLAPLPGERFDLIVANPPYIEADDPHLTRGDLRFEPIGALASGVDGLDDIRRIVAEAMQALVVGGWLLLEHGWQQGTQVRALFAADHWTQVETIVDLEARDRVTCARLLKPA
jgi:release factor glutamine methyltransferase